MQRFIHISLAPILIGLALLIGCDDHRNGGPIDLGGSIASIDLRATHTVIRGYAGEVRSERIIAVGRDLQGVAVPGEKITFAILNPQPWKGTLSTPEDAVTNETGQMTAGYNLALDRSDNVVIEARSGNVTARITLQILVVDDLPCRLTLEAERQVLAVPPNQTRQTKVTATLVDEQGTALSGMMIRFRTDPPGLGYVDSDTATTDNNGRVTRTFTSIVNKYGLCAIVAQVGDSAARTTIEIRATGVNAYITLTTPTPFVRAARGVDAVINLTATVVDANRKAVSGTTVAFEALPLNSQPTFGSLTALDTTDGNGRADAVFHSLGQFGKQRVKVKVLPSGWSGQPQPDPGKGGCRPAGADDNEIFDEIIIEARELLAEISSLSLRAFPDFLNLPPDSNGVSNIEAVVRNDENNAVEGVFVKFTTTRGALSNITATDAGGIARAVFRSNYETGEAVVKASIEGTQFERAVRIVVQQAVGNRGRLTLTTDRESIYADNGLTYAALTALLSDEEGQALAGKQIIFTKTHGTVNSPVTTDSLGIARAIFRDIGMPSLNEEGRIVPAVISAKYNPLALQASVEITILPRNPVARITLQSAVDRLNAGGRDSTSIIATCFLANNDFAPAGTLVRFESNIGRFASAAVPITGNYGIAETKYISGSAVGQAVLKASVQNEDNILESNPVSIELIPGPPRRVVVSADPERLITNNPDSYSTVSALVVDTVGNPVASGTLVRFAASLGNITPSAITNAHGIAVARLSAGVQAGLCEITAAVGTIEGRTTVTFVAGRPNSIELSANPLNIAVAGTGGTSTSTLTAIVKDANGNPVEQPTIVYFQLLNEPPVPGGCNINNRGQIDSALTAHGRAVVSLNSGLQVGGKVIRAYTWGDDARTALVEVTLATIMVVSGPPFSLDIDVNNNGSNALGGAWKIEVSARVFDMYRNPVADNIPVVFTVDPAIASISSGYTGNRSSVNTSEPGLAYANLIYQSGVTFSQVTITTSVATPLGRITGSKLHTLPLQDGVLELNLDPGNWRFERSRPNDIASIRVWAVLKDGHLVEINNAPVLFLTDRSQLYWFNNQSRSYIPFYPNPARKLTGVQDALHNELPGQATVYLRGVMNDFFLDDITIVEDAQVTASVEGYEDVRAEPVFVYFTRR